MISMKWTDEAFDKLLRSTWEEFRKKNRVKYILRRVMEQRVNRDIGN
jgi:hypothetical protein